MNTMRGRSLSSRSRARAACRRGQSSVELSMLIIFFMIIFFSAIQVCLTAMEKFHLNHMALQTARAWSSGPNDSPDDTNPSGAFNFLKEREQEKKRPGTTGTNLTRADGIRLGTGGGGATVRTSTTSGPYPAWALSPLGDQWEGVVVEGKLPIIMPFAELVMGAGSLPNPPRTYGHRYIDARCYVPMKKEPADPMAWDKDNNGVEFDQFGTGFTTSKSDIDWDDMESPTVGD